MAENIQTTKEKKKTKKSYAISFALVAVLTIATLFISLYGAGEGDFVLGAKQIWNALITCSPLYLAVIALVMILTYCIEALVMVVFCRLYTRHYYFHQGLANSFIGAFYNNVTPGASGGQVMQVYTLKKQGIEVVIALDISNSMLAEDVSPNRLECAKQLISSTIDRMDNDKVGIVVFAGDAFNMLPITSDNISANMFLDAINPSLITRQGTAIGDAINLTTKSFTSKENVGRAVIVITDGEDHEGGAEEAAKEAAKKGIRVFIIGVGKDSGAPVPDPADKNKYIVDKNGQTVISRLNKDMCRKIAEAGKGTFIYLTNAPTARERLFNDLDKIKKSEMSSAVYSSYAEQFQWVALIALIALIIDAIIMERKNHVLRKLNLFKKR